MDQINMVLKAVDVFLSYGELGATDARNLNTVIHALNKDGMISKADLINHVFAESKNPDAAYRNYLSRVQSAIAQTCEAAQEKGDNTHILILESLKIQKINASKSTPAHVQFTAHIPPELEINTVRPNRDYQPENYIKSTGTDPKQKPVDKPIRLFISYAENDSFIMASFLKEFTAHCESREQEGKRSIIHWSMNDLVLGHDFDQEIKSSLKDADFGLALISEAFFDSTYIRDVELDFLLNEKKLLPVGLDCKVKGKVVVPPVFFSHVGKKYPKNKNVEKALSMQMFYLSGPKGDFFSDCDEDIRKVFIKRLYNEIQKKIEAMHKTSSEKNDCACITQKPLGEFPDFCVSPTTRKELYNEKEHIPSLGQRSFIDTCIVKAHAQEPEESKPEKKPQKALSDMLEWLIEDNTPLYALLGDYGMGKTFTCRMFALELEKRHQRGENIPRPIYIDLRDVPTFVNVDRIIRQPTLEEMLTSVLRQAHPESTYDVQELIRAIHEGKFLIIFDGLDEKLVYYSKDMRSQFLRELLRVFPQNQKNSAPVKIVISCRTHHFETITEMDNFLLGFGRSGIKGNDYQVLNLLPFSQKQIRELLLKLMDKNDTEKIFSFIEDDHFLNNLATRPFILRQIAQALPELRQKKEQGLPLNTASFYDALIRDNMNRDDEKHILKIRHKRRLLIDLAAALWKKGSQTWQIDDLNDWFQDWLHSDPSLLRQYQGEDGHILEMDLRNSTLLVRFGESEFGFSHSSMQEYFLSQWIIRQWQENPDFELENPISSLTAQFLFDSLIHMNSNALQSFFKGIARTFSKPCQQSSLIALDLISRLFHAKVAIPTFNTIDLNQAVLANGTFSGLTAETLILNQADLHNSSWINCNFEHIELQETNLNQSLWKNCHVKSIAGLNAGKDNSNGLTLANSVFPESLMTELPQTWHMYSGNQRSNPFKKNTQAPLIPSSDLRLHHSGQTNKAIFSPDGKTILSASDDNTLKLWNLNGTCIQTFKGHDSFVLGCAFSPDGKHILSTSLDKTLKSWDLEATCIQTFNGHDSSVRSCAFSPDGKLILSASRDNTLKLWDLEATCTQTFNGHDGSVISCAFSPDGQLILSASEDKTLKLWDLNGTCIQTFKEHRGHVFSCAFSPDGKLILSASRDKTLKLWDFNGRCIQTFKGHDSFVLSCAFSPDGKHILSASLDKTLKSWDLNGDCIQTFAGHHSWVDSCSFSPDGKRILSASNDGTLKLWDFNGRCIQTFKGHNTSVSSCDFSPDDKRILSASYDKTLKLWDLNGRCLQTFSGHEGSVENCAFSPDGKTILSASRDRTLKLWDLNGICIQTFKGHDGLINSCAFSPDGKRILSASYDKTLKLWDLNGACLQTFIGHDRPVLNCVFSPDGNLILSASWDKTLKLWDLNGRCLQTFSGHEDSVGNCAFSPDGKTIMSASSDKALKLWDLNGICIQTFKGHDGLINSCAFSPDGKRILSASYDKTLKLWDLNGRCLQTFSGHEDSVENCAFSPDGQFILSGSFDGTIRRWDISQGTQDLIINSVGQQWWSMRFEEGCLRKIKGTELAWQMVNFAKDDQTWFIDETDCFEYHPSLTD